MCGLGARDRAGDQRARLRRARRAGRAAASVADLAPLRAGARAGDAGRRRPDRRRRAAGDRRRRAGARPLARAGPRRAAAAPVARAGGAGGAARRGDAAAARRRTRRDHHAVRRPDRQRGQGGRLAARRSATRSRPASSSPRSRPTRRWSRSRRPARARLSAIDEPVGAVVPMGGRIGRRADDCVKQPTGPSGGLTEPVVPVTESEAPPCKDGSKPVVRRPDRGGDKPDAEDTLRQPCGAGRAAVALGHGGRRRPRTRSPTSSISPTTSSATTGASRCSASPQVSVDKGPLAGQGRPAHRGRRGHRPGADQLAQQHHPPEARRDPRRRGLGLGAQPDDQAGLRRRHRRHQLRPDRDRALRLRARLELGHDPGGDGRVDGRAARRQGQGHRRPRPRRRADLGAAAGRLREGARPSIPTSRSSATTTATTRSGRSSPASPRCSPPTRRSTAS